MADWRQQLWWSNSEWITKKASSAWTSASPSFLPEGKPKTPSVWRVLPPWCHKVSLPGKIRKDYSYLDTADTDTRCRWDRHSDITMVQAAEKKPAVPRKCQAGTAETTPRDPFLPNGIREWHSCGEGNHLQLKCKDVWEVAQVTFGRSTMTLQVFMLSSNVLAETSFLHYFNVSTIQCKQSTALKHEIIKGLT